MKCLTADEIVQRAKEKIVPLTSQESTLWDIATIISLHLKRLMAIENGADIDFLPVISQLIIASTGSGKSYLISQLAKVAGLDFHVIDASALTLSGYKGINLSEAFVAAKNSSRNAEHFSKSIILFDEFDKCAYGKNGYHRQGNVQPNFLTVLEGNGITCDSEIIDTSKMLFLFSGAFQGLEHIVEDRIKPPKKIGFGGDSNTANMPENPLSLATMDDIQAYGFNRELLGRIGSLHYIPPLKKEDFKQLITGGRTSLGEKYNALFANSGVTLTITDEACNIISDLAERRNMGARAANPIIFETLLSAFRAVDSDKRISRVVLTGHESNLATEYILGERFPVSTEGKHSSSLQDISLVLLINSEASINTICTEMLSSCKSKISPDIEPVCYYFLQVVLRYLALETNADDQLLSSISKIADCTRWCGGENSTFDILITDVTHRKNLDADYVTLSHFYHRFKSLEDPYTSTAICNAVNEIRLYWPNKRQTKKGTE